MQFELQQMVFTLPEALKNLDFDRRGICAIDGELSVPKGPAAVIVENEVSILIVRDKALVPNGSGVDVHHAAHFKVSREDELHPVIHLAAPLDDTIPHELIPRLTGRVDTPIGYLDIAVEYGMVEVTTDHDALACGLMQVQPSIYQLDGEWIFMHSNNTYREIKLTAE